MFTKNDVDLSTDLGAGYSSSLTSLAQVETVLTKYDAMFRIQADPSIFKKYQLKNENRHFWGKITSDSAGCALLMLTKNGFKVDPAQLDLLGLTHIWTRDSTTPSKIIRSFFF